jgi:tetratricopeptide (TPR) repeat protein
VCFTDAAAALLCPHVLRLPHNSVTRTDLSTPDDPARALAWCDAEQDNLVAVITHATEHGHHAVAWRLADTLTGYLSLATLARATGDYQHAIDHYARAHNLAERACCLDCVASASGNLGIMCWTTGQPETAIAHYTRALEISRGTGRLAGQATHLRRLGLTYWGSAGSNSQPSTSPQPSPYSGNGIGQLRRGRRYRGPP